jgi:hypothetical protein
MLSEGAFCATEFDNGLADRNISLVAPYARIGLLDGAALCITRRRFDISCVPSDWRVRHNGESDGVIPEKTIDIESLGNLDYLVL